MIPKILTANRPGWDKPVVCIAGGPSLSEEQLALIAEAHQQGRVRAIGVNNAYLRAPWVDTVYAMDQAWWKRHVGLIRQRMLPAELVSPDPFTSRTYELLRVRAANNIGLGHGIEINTGGNSGYGAVSLAHFWGSRRIILVGYDMKPGPNGEGHWHTDHPSPMQQTMQFREWIHRFKALARDAERVGTEVINATPGSALPWFPMVSLAEALPGELEEALTEPAAAAA